MAKKTTYEKNQEQVQEHVEERFKLNLSAITETELYKRRQEEERIKKREQALYMQQQQSKLQEIIKNNEMFTYSMSVTGYYVEKVLAEGCIISSLELDGYVSPSGGHLNWAIFEVVGIKPETRRKNKRKYEAHSDIRALELAEEDGLLNPEIIKIIPHDPPTDRQVSYLESFNTTLPFGASKWDVSAIIDRIKYSEDLVKEIRVSEDTVREYVRPIKSPNENFAMFAHRMEIEFSKFVGENALLRSVVFNLKDRDKAAFFAYCVLCGHNGIEIGNMLESPLLEQLYAFGDKAMKSESLMRSINGRDSDDYLTPHKGTAAYKAVAEYFNL